MAKKLQQTLSYSVLDRLLGPEYGSAVTTVEGQPNPAFVERIVKTIARDVQNLLNTRKLEMDLPEQYKELRPSIVDFGIIDLTTLNARSERDREAFRLSVKRAVEAYEPRLKKIVVDIVDSPSDYGLIFRFNIEAVLLIEPTPLTLQFDSVLPSDTRMFEVKGTVNER